MGVVVRGDESLARPDRHGQHQQAEYRQVESRGKAEPEGCPRVGAVRWAEGEGRQLHDLPDEGRDEDQARQHGREGKSTLVALGDTGDAPPDERCGDDDSCHDRPEGPPVSERVLGRCPLVVDVE